MSELDLKKLEQEFIAEGRSNGDLDPILARDPVNYEGREDGEIWLNFTFNIYDWKSLYFGELQCPQYEPMIGGEKTAELRSQWMAKFHDCCADYPLLARIYDMYADAIYCPEEVQHLKRQCLELLERTGNAGAWRALAKLIVICKKAEDLDMGVLLAAD
jgi:hypothetical protein